MQVSSPKNGFVTQVFVANGQSISMGDPIILLDSTEEDRDQSRADAINQVRMIMLSRLLSPEQRSANRRIAELSVRVAEVWHLSREDLFEVAGMEHELGRIKHEELIKAEVARDLALLDIEKAKVQLQILDYSNDADLAAHDVLLKQVEADRSYTEAKKLRLRVTSPISGTIKLLVGIGSFTKLGSSLAVVE